MNARSSTRNSTKLRDSFEPLWHTIEQQEESPVHPDCTVTEGHQKVADADSSCQDGPVLEDDSDQAQEMCSHHKLKHAVEAAQRRRKKQVTSPVVPKYLTSNVYGCSFDYFNVPVPPGANRIAQTIAREPVTGSEPLPQHERSQHELVSKTLQEATFAAMLFEKALSAKQAVKSKVVDGDPEEEAPSRKRRRFQRRNSVVIIPKHLRLSNGDSFPMLSSPSVQIGVIRSEESCPRADHSDTESKTELARAG